MQDPFNPIFFKRLQQLKIRTRKKFLGTRQGGHISNRRGHGLEFSDHRAYAPGDDFRYIDWGVLGRTDRMYVKQFQEEQDLNVVVLLDASSSMAYPEGEGKFELAKSLALSLGYIAMTDGDSVTFSFLGQENSPKFSGAKSLPRAMKHFENISPQGTFRFPNEVRAAITRQKLPGRCFLISDFMFPREDQIETLRILLQRNYEISVFQVLAPSELTLKGMEGGLLVDSESGAQHELYVDSSVQREYAEKLSHFVGDLEEYCERKGIAHVLISSEESIQDVVLTRLPSRGILK